MARWKVTSKHYIHAEQYGQPTEWERQEVNQDTGRMFRKAYKVPMYIDPDDPYCINKHVGFCVVARKGSEQPGDIVFFGPPTIDMEPLDAEANAETEAERPKWKNPIDGLDPIVGQDFGQRMLEMLERQISAAQSTQAPVSLAGATTKEISDLKEIVAAQQKQIEALMKGLATGPAHDDEEELTHPDPGEPIPPLKEEIAAAPPPIRVPPRQGGMHRRI
jgi:hypothetical protein